MTWQKWEPRPPYTTGDGRTVWLFYAPGANGDRWNGGTVRAFDHDVALADLDYAKYLGQLFWTNHKVIEYVEVREDWQRQGIATAMWELAREAEPELRHSTTHRSVGGEAWIRAVSPEATLPHGALDGPDPEPAVRWTDRVRRILGRQ